MTRRPGAIARATFLDGVLVVDYPPEEAESFAAALQAEALDPIFLLAPTSTERRIREVARVGSGYLYSSFGSRRRLGRCPYL